MRKFSILTFILLLLCCFTLSSCSNDNDSGTNTPKTIDVKDAVENIKREKNYRIQIETHITETENDEVTYQQEYKIQMLTKENIRKIEITYSEVVITLYTIIENDIEYILFNSSLLQVDTDNIWVKATKEQINNLMKNNTEINSTTNIFDLMTTLFDFFMNLKNEYFTLNDIGNYEFNQTGKDALRIVVQEILEELLSTTDNPLSNGTSIDSKCTVRVNKKYVTNLLTDIYVTPINTPNNKVTFKNITSLDKFKEVEIKFPVDIISYEDFEKSLSE